MKIIIVGLIMVIVIVIMIIILVIIILILDRNIWQQRNSQKYQNYITRIYIAKIMTMNKQYIEIN